MLLPVAHIQLKPIAEIVHLFNPTTRINVNCAHFFDLVYHSVLSSNEDIKHFKCMATSSLMDLMTKVADDVRCVIFVSLLLLFLLNMFVLT